MLDTSGCNLNINWIVRVKSDSYSSHSLINDGTEEVVQNVKYNITTHTSDLLYMCGNNVNANFSINFFDIGPYEEVLVSCGLTTSESNDVDNSVAVLSQCEFHN